MATPSCAAATSRQASKHEGDRILVRMEQQLGEGMCVEWPTKSVERCIAKVHEVAAHDVNEWCHICFVRGTLGFI